MYTLRNKTRKFLKKCSLCWCLAFPAPTLCVRYDGKLFSFRPNGMKIAFCAQHLDFESIMELSLHTGKLSEVFFLYKYEGLIKALRRKILQSFEIFKRKVTEKCLNVITKVFLQTYMMEIFSREKSYTKLFP